MEGGAFQLKNEHGFTFLEGLLSLSFILLLCGTLFPIMFGMMNKLEDEKKEMTSYRILFEYVEGYPYMELPFKTIRTNRGIEYEVLIENGRACVEYEKNKKCVE